MASKNDVGAEPSGNGNEAPVGPSLEDIARVVNEQVAPVISQLRGDVSGIQSKLDKSLETGNAMNERLEEERAAKALQARHDRILRHFTDEDERAEAAKELAAQAREDAEARKAAAKQAALDRANDVMRGKEADPRTTTVEDPHLQGYKTFVKDYYDLDPESPEVLEVWEKTVKMTGTEVQRKNFAAQQLLSLKLSQQAGGSTTTATAGDGGGGEEKNPPVFDGEGSVAGQLSIDELDDKWIKGEMDTPTYKALKAKIAAGG